MDLRAIKELELVVFHDLLRVRDEEEQRMSPVPGFWLKQLGASWVLLTELRNHRRSRLGTERMNSAQKMLTLRYTWKGKQERSLMKNRENDKV